jgi:hypothetical protein
MRTPANAERVQRFMKQLGSAVRGEGRVYLTGGASALLVGWRDSTMDIDLHPDPEAPGFFEALPGIKEALDINIELAAPFHFVPVLPEWKERSVYIARHGKLDFFHFDFYSQALSKLERGHERDLRDVTQMVGRHLIFPARLMELFDRIVPQLIRYPSLDPESLTLKLKTFVEAHP